MPFNLIMLSVLPFVEVIGEKCFFLERKCVGWEGNLLMNYLCKTVPSPFTRSSVIE